jgi:hypothetical protein
MKFEINDRVMTPNGYGVYVGIDLPESRAARYVVKLDVDPFKYDTACYWPDDVKPINRDEQHETIS